MRIVLLGSTPVTAACASRLLYDGKHEIVGYAPSHNPTIRGRMHPLIQVVPIDTECDLRLSIQYDRRLVPDGKTGNIHTGLLPSWGGSDILYHTLREGAETQGLSFHLINDVMDGGPLIATCSYPVLPGDTIPALYQRMLLMAPGFVSGCVDLVEVVGLEALAECPAEGPFVYNKRGEIRPEDRAWYARTLEMIKEIHE